MEVTVVQMLLPGAVPRVCWALHWWSLQAADGQSAFRLLSHPPCSRLTPDSLELRGFSPRPFIPAVS